MERKREIDSELADRVSQVFKLSGLKRYELAKLFNVDPRTIYTWKSKRSPISVKVALNILKELNKRGIIFSSSWLLCGKGEEPFIQDSVALSASNTVFEHFNLDFSYATMCAYFKQIYPKSIHLFVDNNFYLPRILPNTLLIATPMKVSMHRPDWPYGYLYQKSDLRVIPVDIVKKEENLIAKPFEIDGFNGVNFNIESKEIYPIINIRPYY